MIRTLSWQTTSLHRAAWLGDGDKVRELLLQRKYHVNCEDFNGRAPLHYACVKGYLGVVKMLVSETEFRANMLNQDILYHVTPLMVATGDVLDYMVQALNQNKLTKTAQEGDSNAMDCGNTVLHYACAVGNTDLVCTIIREHKVNVNAKNQQGNTPVHIAALHGREELVLALIEDFGCDMSIMGFRSRSLFHQACSGGNVSLVRALICNYKVDINAKDIDGETPVHAAACCGRTEVVMALINEFGCNTSISGSTGRSLLHYACIGGNANLVRTLIQKHKANINAKDDDGGTPVHKAAEVNEPEIALLLIDEFGCDIGICGYLGRSLLHSACGGGSIDLVRTLLQRLPNNAIYARDNNGDTPAHVAALNGREEVVLALIKDFNFDVNTKSFEGRSLLHSACSNGHVNVVSSVSKYISPFVVDNDGYTPLHISSAIGYLECVEALLSINSPLLVRNKYGNTPRDIATDSVRSLINEYQKEHQDKIYVDYKEIQEIAKRKYSKPQPITRIFVIGNPEAGKSTLVQSLKKEGFLESFFRVTESSVPLHTAGIIPSVFISKHYGRVLFYDFAGDPEYYSSHAAILENLASSKCGNNLFVIVVDLREENATITNILHFWSSFVRYQKFSMKREPFLIAVGSHLDLIKDGKTIEEKQEIFKDFLEASDMGMSSFFMLDCCKPGSKEIQAVQKHLISLTMEFPQYKLSLETSTLLGLLEKDFSNVTACPVTMIRSHIEFTGIPLPTDSKSLSSILERLHDIGVLLMIGDRREGDVHVVLNTSRLTNEVHEALFSKEKKEASMSTGVIPKSQITSLLPENITTECLIQLQYCQEIKLEDIGIFPSTSQSSSVNQSLLFFPALCSLEKGQLSWVTPSHLSYSIGWFAQCVSSHDHFSSRFLHVLLLRLVYRFSLSAPGFSPSQDQASAVSPEHDMFQRRCTVWKTGAHWLMKEGVECMVEVVKDSKGVVVITKSEQEFMGNCINILNRVISCVMEAKAEFCHSIRPQFFLLGSTDGEDYLGEDNLFAMSDVESVLTSPEGTETAVVSIGGKSFLKHSKLLCMRKLTHWDSLFPIEFSSVVHYLKDVVEDLFDLGIQLKLSESVLHADKLAYHPRDIDEWRREIVRKWMSSTLDPPCWLHVVQALRNINFNMSADEIEGNYGVAIKLERKLLDRANSSLTPDMEFVKSFSEVVGHKWPSLASLLSLSSEEIEEIKNERKDHAFHMLKKWVSREGATYGHLFQKLKTISLFHY